MVDLAIDFVHFLLQHLLHDSQFVGAGLVEEFFLLHLLQIGSEVGVSRTVLFSLRAEGELEVEVFSLGGLQRMGLVLVELALDHLGLLGGCRRDVLIVSNSPLLVFLTFLPLYVRIDLFLQSLVLLTQLPLLLLLPA